MLEKNIDGSSYLVRCAGTKFSFYDMKYLSTFLTSKKAKTSILRDAKLTL